MSFTDWKKQVLANPGAYGRVKAIEHDIRQTQYHSLTELHRDFVIPLQGLHEFRDMSRKEKFVAAHRLKLLLLNDRSMWRYKDRWNTTPRSLVLKIDHSTYMRERQKLHMYAAQIANEWLTTKLYDDIMYLTSKIERLEDKLTGQNDWLNKKTDMVMTETGYRPYVRNISHTGKPIPLDLEKHPDPWNYTERKIENEQ